MACEAHRKEFTETPTLDEIVHFDQWARVFVKEAISKKLAKATITV